MYNFIVDLFTEDDYSSLLGESEGDSKNKNAKILVVPPNTNNSPFVIESVGDDGDIDEKSPLDEYNRGELRKYFNLNKFINPTHNNANNIGTNSALISHSPTHYKITKAFIGKDEQYPNGNTVIKFPPEKIDAFEKSVKKTEYYNQFPELCDRVASFFRDFDRINPENGFGLGENDFIVFLVNKLDIERYSDVVDDYTSEKILKYDTFAGSCDSCGKQGEQLYMLTRGNMFDLGKGRKFLLRHPTRYKTNPTSKSPENFNVCKECAMRVYDFFEYIKKYKFYRYVFPTTITVDKNDYKDYSSDPIGILKMLKTLYNRNRSQEFDYVMMIADPKVENIEFRYVNNFNYILPNENPQINVQDIPIRSTLKDLESRVKEGGITSIQNGGDKSVFLRELNLIFNNTLARSLFETDPKNLMKSLHPFLKLKTIEYNFIIRNFIYFQDVSFFDDRIYSKLFREMLSELVTNPSLRDEMKIGPNKIRFFLTIYFKYLNIESNGGDTITEYTTLKDKMKDAESFDLENDFEASYCMGQIFYYLLQVSKTPNRLNLFTKYTMNVHNMDILKTKLVTVLEKYSHNEYLDHNRRFHNLIANVLAFEFNKSYEDNKIPLYTGYFDSNYLYTSTKEKEELESPQEEEN